MKDDKVKKWIKIICISFILTIIGSTIFVVIEFHKIQKDFDEIEASIEQLDEEINKRNNLQYNLEEVGKSLDELEKKVDTLKELELLDNKKED